MKKKESMCLRLRRNFLSVALLPTLALSLVLCVMSYYLLTQQAINQNHAKLSLAVQSMQTRMELVSDLMNNLSSVNGTSSAWSIDSLYSLLINNNNQKLPFDVYKLPYYRRIRSTISNTYLRNNRYINGVFIITSTGQCYSFSDAMDLLNDAKYDVEYWLNKSSDPNRNYWIMPKGMQQLYSQRLTSRIDSSVTFGMKMYHHNTNNLIALALIDLNKTFFEPLNGITLTGGSLMYVMDDEGILWFTSGMQEETLLRHDSLINRLVGKHGYFLEMNTQRIVAYEHLNNFSGLTIVYDSVSPLTATIFSATMGICAVFCLLALLYATTAALHTSRTLSQPIAHLANEMTNSVQKLPSAVAPNAEMDEIDVLYRRYNEMLDSINQHIKEKYADQLALSLMKMKAMEAQMDSHFLYNTMDCIYSMSLVGGAPDVARVCKSLSDMFRYISKTPSATVTVREEMQHVLDYLTIQQARFRDKVRFDINVDEGIIHKHMLKLILQPLVENAFKHGFSKRPGLYSVNLTGEMKEGSLRFCVIDNGDGMSDERLATVRGMLEGAGETDENVGIGLSNIVSRLRLYYNNSASLTIDGAPQMGTKVIITIPEGKVQ